MQGKVAAMARWREGSWNRKQRRRKVRSRDSQGKGTLWIQVLTVLGVSLVFRAGVPSIFYQMSARAGGGSKKVEQETVVDVVVAAKPLSVGISVKPDDVKVVKSPAAGFPKGAFSKVEEVIDLPVISNILLDEPISMAASRLAGRMGLAPVIPVGMRAVSVRVNEVVGVASTYCRSCTLTCWLPDGLRATRPPA
jgi:Flp pilus assembly protein CpaB